MAQTTYWDPGNLLQITDDDGRSGEIQCVGRAKRAFNSRCPWTIENNDRIEVLSALARMAARRPADTTHEELRRLACSCLCQRYHSNQREDVARKWAGVVRRAADQYDRLVNEARSSSSLQQHQQGQQQQQQQQWDRLPTPESEDAIAIKLELAGVQAQLRQTDAERLRLEHALAAARRQGAEHIGSLSAELRAAQEKVEFVEKGYVQLRNMLSMTQKEHESLGQHAADAERELETVRGRLRTIESEKRDSEYRVAQSVSTLERNVRNLSITNMSLKEQLAIADIKSVGSQREANKLSEDNDSLRAERNKLRSDYDTIVEKLGSMESEAKDTREKAQRLVEENDKLNEIKNTTLGTLKSLGAELNATRDEARHHREESEKLRLERDSTIEKLKVSEFEAQEARERSQLLAEAKDKLHDTHNATLDKLRKTETAADDARDNTQRCMAEIEKLRLEYDLTAEKLRSAETEAETVRGEVRRLEADLKIRDGSLEKSCAELGNERDRNAQLQDTATALTQRVDSLETSIAACGLHRLGTWIGKRSKKLTSEGRSKKEARKRG